VSEAKAMPGGAVEVQMDVAAQRLSFGAGLYLITLSGGAVRLVSGMALPCVRIDPLPPMPDMPGRAHVACLTEGQWLSSENQSAFLRIEGGSANLILTTYNVAGDKTPPNVRIRLVKNEEAAAQLIASPAPVLKRPELVDPGKAEPSLPLSLMVHCSGVGDVRVAGGEWAGGADDRAAIEAFSIAPQPLEGDVTLEYQSVMGLDWSSPWVNSPELSGSRGLALPLFGLRTRFVGADADQYELVIWARCGNQELGPVTSGELSSNLKDPITSLRVAIRRKAAVVQARPPTRRGRS
jgi:hypothetical protein